MTWADSGGARHDSVDPFETLAPLAAAATVRIGPPHEGYDVGEHGPRPWGSGFFVAPGWVLTCAHVALNGARGAGPAEGGEREVGLSFGDAEQPVRTRGVVEWAQPGSGPANAPWPAPDLALVRLLEPHPHECVWLTERTATAFTSGQVAFFGWAEESGWIEPVSGRCTILGVLGSDGRLKLGHEDEIPEGASGGPIVDLERGEVIGVLKARRNRGRDGGLGMSVVQLRRLPQPSRPPADERGDIYHRVMHAHDRYHADRHQEMPAPVTWTDAQNALEVTPGGVLLPGQRTELLGLLAELPPPASTRQLGALIAELRGRPHTGTLPAPRGWRDALGMLYDGGTSRAGLETVLRFAIWAATADHPYPPAEGAEERLREWVRDTAVRSRLDNWTRNRLFDEQHARQRARRASLAGLPGLPAPRDGGLGLSFDEVPYAAGDGPVPPAGSDGKLLPRAAAGEAEPELPPMPLHVLLELTPHGWEPSRYDWQVYAPLPTGELIAVDGDSGAEGFEQPPERLRAALDEAFRRADDGDQPVMLLAALPYSLLGLPLEEWHVTGAPGSRLGDQRPVVYRCSNPDPAAADDDEERAARLTRWEQVHAGPLVPGILDCEDHQTRPLPDRQRLASLPAHTVPVLCRTGEPDADPDALFQVLSGGYGVVLWRRAPQRREPGCADFHRGVHRTVAQAGRAGALPEELRRLRLEVTAGLPESYWSRDLALLYAEPEQAYADAGDLLEAL